MTDRDPEWAFALAALALFFLIVLLPLIV